MCEAGDGFDGEIIREPFLNSIREGVEQGIYIAMPDMSYLKDDLIDSFKNSINIWKINERG
jgi:hypothetical protein